MKRSLRSRNSCLPIQNIFEKQLDSDLLDLIKIIPKEVSQKIPRKKFIICQDLLNIEFKSNPKQSQLKIIKLGSNLLKQKINQLSVQKKGTQQKPESFHGSYFDCIINQEDYGHKKLKYEQQGQEKREIFKNNIEYKIQYNYYNDYVNNQMFMSYYQKQQNVKEMKQYRQKYLDENNLQK